MKVAIHQPNFLPWLGFIAKAAQADVLVLLDDVPFTKGGYTNRVQVAGTHPGKPEWLTVPVRQRLGQTCNEVMIDGTNWEPQVFAQLHRVYRDAPGWTRCSEVWTYLLDGTHRHLSRMNHDLLGALLGLFEVSCEVRLASDLRTNVLPATEGLIDLVYAVNGSEYVAGGSGMIYEDADAWELAGLRRSVSRFTPPEANGSLSALHFALTDKDPAGTLQSCIREEVEA